MKKKNQKRDYYALKMLGLIFFGMAGVFILIYLITQAFAQKNILNGILIGIKDSVIFLERNDGGIKRLIEELPPDEPN